MHELSTQTTCALCGQSEGHSPRCSVTRHGVADAYRMSACCRALVRVGGEGTTHWWVCTACSEPREGGGLLMGGRDRARIAGRSTAPTPTAPNVGKRPRPLLLTINRT